MNKYKVEIKQTNIFIVDVLANDKQEATDKANEKFAEMIGNGTYHYNQIEGTEEEIGTIYDVTNTDDPFNP